jgi:putative hydrolase of HD superfamily
MTAVADFLFETQMLKKLPRSGYAFLGAGDESVAEHTCSVALVAWVMSQMEKDIDGLRLISMCLLHDLPEARIGDLNYVQRKYVTAHEDKAVADTAENLPFGDKLKELVAEFNGGQTTEAQLARDADQLALLVDLKAIFDNGHQPAAVWMENVAGRLTTALGKELAESIRQTSSGRWWLENLLGVKA